MSRIKRGIMHVKRRRKLLKAASGFLLGRKNQIKAARQATTKAGQHAYRDRRLKKRDFRQLWNIKIGAAARQNDLSYSTLISQLKAKNISLNRKMLADLAEHHEAVFQKLVKAIQ